MHVLVIIPAYNEEENIVRVVDNLIRNYPQYDYAVVNDGSRDDTAAICRAHGFSLLDLPVNLGLAGAFQTGMRYAYTHGYDAAIQLDGDGQHDPVYIDMMLRTMQEEECDIVIGSRFVTEKKPHSLRMIGSRVISFAVLLASHKKLTDPTSGMRLYNRRMLQLFAENLNFGPEPDTISYLMHLGFTCREVQIEMHERIAGTSYLTLTRSMRYMAHMCLSTLLIQLFRQRRV